jgi:hypothetical protein
MRDATRAGWAAPLARVAASVTSTADAGTAHVTLGYGGPDAFAAACTALR